LDLGPGTDEWSSTDVNGEAWSLYKSIINKFHYTLVLIPCSPLVQFLLPAGICHRSGAAPLCLCSSTPPVLPTVSNLCRTRGPRPRAHPKKLMSHGRRCCSPTVGRRLHAMKEVPQRTNGRNHPRHPHHRLHPPLLWRRGPPMDCPAQLGQGMLVAGAGRDFHRKGKIDDGAELLYNLTGSVLWWNMPLLTFATMKGSDRLVKLIVKEDEAWSRTGGGENRCGVVWLGWCYGCHLHDWGGARWPMGKLNHPTVTLLQCALLSLLLLVPFNSKLPATESSESLGFMVGRGGEQFLVARRP
jgi:hypothetical protein